MIIDADVVTLSRLQFALTALYHFLFVPLTLGLSWMLAIMEAVYVMTGREVWKRMTQFWGVLFGINFAMGVATGVTMEFQFGTNWAYYSHYVGDIFGAPLAIEGLMAFFLEATFIGLFFFGWDTLSRIKHLLVTWLLALGTNLSALWILIANAWMQNPVGSEFNLDTMRMEVTDLRRGGLQSGGAGEVRAHGERGLRARRDVRAVDQRVVPAARTQRRFRQALDDGGGELRPGRGAQSWSCSATNPATPCRENQKMKLAAIEAMWDTEPPPASFTAVRLSGCRASARRICAIHIPWVMGLIGTRSIDDVMPGIDELVDDAKGRIGTGIQAYDAMLMLRRDKRRCAGARRRFDAHDKRSRLRAAAEALHGRSAPAPRRPTSRRPPTARSRTCRCCSGRSASWSAAACISSRCSRSRSGWPRSAQLDSQRWYLQAWRCGACRCRGSRSSWAGSSPNTAASRGRSKACCRPRSACRRCRRRRSLRASLAASCSSTPRWRSSTRS